jgi:prolyl-tRNA synthetase
MKLSHYFLPILKENPSEASIVSHRLMLRAGMIRQLGSGIYNWLPLGLRVLKNIENIVRQEMDKAGAVEILMPTLQPAELWQESGRYDDYGQEMLRIKDRHKRDMLYGPTAEEVVTDIFRNNVKSYKDLPLNLYNIQWKFRDEIRPRFGVMRGREFLMKDAYSFDIDYEGAKASYENMKRAYYNTFQRMGLHAFAVNADNGAIGGSLSHEFQILAETGESAIYYDSEFENFLKTGSPSEDELGRLQKYSTNGTYTVYAVADEKHNPNNCPVPLNRLKTARGIEVGHIFNFGDKYTKAMNVFINDKEGKPFHPNMGSYGIGVSRLVGAIIESSHDEAGIKWPVAVAPFKVGIINLRSSDEACTKICDQIYSKLQNANVEALYDDTDNSAGSKFASMDLIGLPWQIAVGPRGVKAGTVELKNRLSGEKQEISTEAALQQLTR